MDRSQKKTVQSVDSGYLQQQTAHDFPQSPTAYITLVLTASQLFNLGLTSK